MTFRQSLILFHLSEFRCESSILQNPTKLLTGFPPRPLDLTDLDRSLASAGVQSGDTIILQLDQDQGAGAGQAAQVQLPC